MKKILSPKERSFITEHTPKSSKNELEFRFSAYEYSKNREENKLSANELRPIALERLRQYLNRNWSFDGQRSTQEESSSIINRAFFRRSIGEDETTIIKKEQRGISYSENYPFSIAAALETPVTNASFEVYNLRNKVRSSYRHPSLNLRIDLTNIRSDDDRNRSEVDLEITGAIDLDALDQELSILMKQLYETEELYTIKEYREIVLSFNSLFYPGTKNDLYMEELLTPARNLHRQDVTMAAFFGQHGNYTVSFKANGLRKVLYFHSQYGLVLLTRTDCNRLYTTLPQGQALLVNTVFEGELIPMEARRTDEIKTPYWLLTYDCLASSLEAKIADENYLRRYSVCDNVKLEDELITMEAKEIIELSSPESFFETNKYAIERLATLNYDTDGLVYTPIVTPYWGISGESIRFKQRTLERTPEICKLKESKNQTFDLIILKNDNDISLGINVGRKIIPFAGTRKHPYTSELYPFRMTAELEAAPSGSIGEFGLDLEAQELVFHKLREKTNSNPVDIVEDNWDLNFEPLEFKTMMGETLQLMRQLHNRIKAELLKPLKAKYILDLGFGKGGDINKYATKEERRIIGVDPSLENLEEAAERIKNRFGYRPQILKSAGPIEKVKGTPFFVLVHAKAEESDLITEIVNLHFKGKKADAIVMMFSLTFFWQSEALLNELCRTISINLAGGGSFIFTTMDGERVPDKIEIKSPLYDLKVEGRDIDITIYHSESVNSIVTAQKEWKVYLDDLILKSGLRVDSIKAFPTFELLNKEEAYLNSFYSYGKLEKNIQDSQMAYERIADEIIPKGEQRPDLNLRHLRPDEYKKLNPSWYQHRNVYRVGNMGEGDCYVHSLLRGYNHPWYKSLTPEQRRAAAAELRERAARRLFNPETMEATAEFDEIAESYGWNEMRRALENRDELVGHEEEHYILVDGQEVKQIVHVDESDPQSYTALQLYLHIHGRVELVDGEIVPSRNSNSVSLTQRVLHYIANDLGVDVLIYGLTPDENLVFAGIDVIRPPGDYGKVAICNLDNVHFETLVVGDWEGGSIITVFQNPADSSFFIETMTAVINFMQPLANMKIYDQRMSRFFRLQREVHRDLEDAYTPSIIDAGDYLDAAAESLSELVAGFDDLDLLRSLYRDVIEKSRLADEILAPLVQNLPESPRSPRAAPPR